MVQFQVSTKFSHSFVIYKPSLGIINYTLYKEKNVQGKKDRA